MSFTFLPICTMKTLALFSNTRNGLLEAAVGIPHVCTVVHILCTHQMGRRHVSGLVEGGGTWMDMWGFRHVQQLSREEKRDPSTSSAEEVPESSLVAAQAGRGAPMVSGLKLVCNVNIVYGNPNSENRPRNINKIVLS
jgi:hypothetical protein